MKRAGRARGAAALYLAVVLAPGAVYAKDSAPGRGGKPSEGAVFLKTADGWKLTARFVPGGRETAVVMLHGLDAGKEEWRPLEAELSRRRIATLAIDMRGHGGSRSQGRGWRSFEDHGPQGEWARMWKDAAAGIRFLKKRGYHVVGVVGASLGANVALACAAAGDEVHFAALLSPGFDYQGVRSDQDAASYGSRPLLLVFSRPDGYSYRSVQGLQDLRRRAGLPIRIIEAKSGHGVQMFNEPPVLTQVADWIAAAARRSGGETTDPSLKPAR